MIWTVAVGSYVLAVLNRSSLGVAGLLAADRFGIKATELASFSVPQLLVYAGMQVPVGVLLDRYGSRRLVTGGLLLITVGQLLFAVAPAFLAALAARAVVGAGDAMVFVSVMRLVAVWFLVREAPVVAADRSDRSARGSAGRCPAHPGAAPAGLDADVRRPVAAGPSRPGGGADDGEGLAVPFGGAGAHQDGHAGSLAAPHLGQSPGTRLACSRASSPSSR